VCNTPDELEESLRDAAEKLGQANEGAVDLVSVARGSTAGGGSTLRLQGGPH